MRQMDREKVILIRLTKKFGCRKREFGSYNGARVNAEDRTGRIEIATFAWGIYSADEKTCLAWGVVPSKDALEADYGGHLDFIGERNEPKAKRTHPI
jgi:hypothetical protein